MTPNAIGGNAAEGAADVEGTAGEFVCGGERIDVPAASGTLARRRSSSCTSAGISATKSGLAGRPAGRGRPRGSGATVLASLPWRSPRPRPAPRSRPASSPRPRPRPRPAPSFPPRPRPRPSPRPRAPPLPPRPLGGSRPPSIEPSSSLNSNSTSGPPARVLRPVSRSNMRRPSAAGGGASPIRCRSRGRCRGVYVSSS